MEELFYLVAGAVAWRGLLVSRAAAGVVAAGLICVCVGTRGAALASPLFWLGFNATYVVFILIVVVFHCVYRGLWGARAAVASVVGLTGLYVLALHNGPARPVASIYVPSAVVALVVFSALYLVRDRLPYSVWLDRLSNVSYPLYLLHGINGYVITRTMFMVTGSYYLAVSVAVVASLSLAVAVHQLVETPTNNLRRRLSRRLGGAADAPVVVATSRSVSPSPLPS